MHETVVQGLGQVLHDLSAIKLLPDAPAHMQFISALEKGILQYIQVTRQQLAQQATQGPPGGGQPGQGPPPGMGGAGPPGGPPASPPGGPPSGLGMPGGGPGGPGGGMPGKQIGPGGGGGMGGFGTPNPDELRRVLAGPASVSGG